MCSFASTLFYSNLVCFTLLFGVALSAFGAPQSTTKVGTFVGKDEDGVATFLGIRYGKPFTEDRRWRPAVPADKRERPTPALEFSSPCPHMDKFNKKELLSRAFSGTEDCLSLNIWSPVTVFGDQEKKKAPVMVFIPGGAFQTGSSSWSPFGFPIYNGANLAKLGDVVVVTINYRLGSNGFLYNKALVARESMAANLGLLDQMEALSWVKANIDAFGGDSKNVTVFGSSSGGMSICNLLATDRAKGLFDKAIIQSGSCWLSTPAYGESIGKEIVKGVRCAEKKSPEALVKCLIETPLQQLASAEPEMNYQTPEVENFKFTPIFDGALFKKIPDEVIATRRHLSVPILIGSNAHEIPPMMMENSASDWQRMIDSLPASKEAKTRIKTYYEGLFPHAYDAMLAALKTDFQYVCRARYFAGHLADNQKDPVYLYHFDKQILMIMEPWIKGSFHGMELYYLFQHVPSYNWLPGFPAHIKLQEMMGELWTHFARHGNVLSVPHFKEWTPYSLSNRIAGSLGEYNGTITDPHGGRCTMLEQLVYQRSKVSLVQ